MKSLNKLLKFHSKKDFFQTYFEKKALFISSKNKQKDINVFDFKDLDQVLSTHKISYPFLKVFKEGVEISRKNFETRTDSNGSLYIDIPKVIEYFSAGNSLILNRIDRLSSKLNSFSRRLEVDLNMKVESNLYLTPANNYGFDIHFDAHDVFVIQLEGSKIWTLYESEIHLITDELRVSKRSQESFIEKSKHLLQKGDVLYIPRGTYHQAKSTVETSMHLTVGLHPLLGYQLINQLAVKAQEELFFRKSVPSVNSSEEEKQEYYQLFAKKMDQFLDPNTLGKLANNKRMRLLTEQDLNFNGVLLNHLKGDSLKEDSIIRMRTGINAELKEGKRILKICMPQQMINLPIFLKPLVAQLFNLEEIRVSEIKEIEDLSQRMKILKQLLTKGFIELVALR